MYKSKKVPVNSITEKISEISIVHKTGQSRVITETGNVFDVKFSDLIASLNGSCINYTPRIKIKYCESSKKQFEKLVSTTNYVIVEKTKRNKEFGYLETYLKYMPTLQQIAL